MERFPATEDWQELRAEWEREPMFPPMPSLGQKSNFGTTTEPDWDALLSE